MPVIDVRTFARSLPKAELHVHLEGSVDPATLLSLAARHGVTPPAADVDGIRRWLRFDGFPSFLERYFFVCGLLRDGEDFQRITEAYLHQAHAMGCVHVEFHVSSSYHIVEQGSDWTEILEGIVAGCDQAEADVGISSLLLPDLSPHLGSDAAHQALDVVLAHPHPRVAGIGMGGPADNWPDEDFESAFDRARDVGLRTVSHAGEHGPAWEVRHAIERFGAERIQHGIGAMQDLAVVELLVDRQIACDVCPGSNLALAAVPSLDVHPLPAMLDAGIKVTLGSDDPPLFATDLLAEYEHAARLASLDEDGLAQLATNSVVESFAAPADVDRWLHR